MKRIVVFVTVAATVVTLIAGPVAAQATTERIPVEPQPYINQLVNPCTGEVVDITGELSGFFETVQTPTGETFTQYHLFIHGTGVGSEGNRYIFQENHNQVRPGSPPISETAPILMINEGAGENWTLIQEFHVSPNGQIREGVAEPICRG
jgi:hypothetical protein